MTFHYPIEIAKDLVAVTSQFSKQSMEVHGIGLVSAFQNYGTSVSSNLWPRQIEKVFDVACTLIDVMACVPNLSIYGTGPQEYLNQLLLLISTLRGGEARFLPLVLAKIRDTLPAISSQLPPTLVGRAAATSVVSGSAFGPLGGIKGLASMSGLNGVSGAVVDGMNAMVGKDGFIKQEPGESSSDITTSTNEIAAPYSAPPFMHYYPLA